MKVSLLEYLDKLEANAKTALLGVDPRATLALIAKLREATALVRVFADGDGDTPDFDRRWRELFEIEVPE